MPTKPVFQGSPVQIVLLHKQLTDQLWQTSKGHLNQTRFLLSVIIQEFFLSFFFKLNNYYHMLAIVDKVNLHFSSSVHEQIMAPDQGWIIKDSLIWIRNNKQFPTFISMD